MKLGTKLMIAELTKFAASGFTMQETATETDLSYAAVGMYSRKYDIKFHRPVESIPSERSERMAALYKSGKTLEQIGTEYGITRERVRQIINKHHGLTAKHGGKMKTAREKRKQVYAARDARSMKKWGCPWSQYVILRDMRKPTRAFFEQKRNAGSRNIGWELTLWQWWTIWQESGHWEERGRGHGYQMCRVRDAGPYAVNNVYIATGPENMKDYWEHAERQTRPLRPPGEELALRRLKFRQYYYRRKFRIAGIPEEQIAAKVSQVCPGVPS